MLNESIMSVGIDIGTSTTKLIISRLSIAQTSGSFALPRYSIVERELLYVSPIFATPLLGADDIDIGQISALIQREYIKANCSLQEMKSGAVIITGETANKRNAERFVHLLAEKAGDFVVATAGADLEGHLAGKGSGAEERSRHIQGVIANIDVGGGTANAALFQRGELLATVTFHVGGRLLRFDDKGIVLSVAPSLAKLLEDTGAAVAPGQTVSIEQLRHICMQMSYAMLGYMLGHVNAKDVGTLLLGDPLSSCPVIEEWMISGGIGALIGEPESKTLKEAARYEDIGLLLAQALLAVCKDKDLKLKSPEQTSRATVIGAGMQSMEISGATVHYDPSLLPLRNLPILKLEITPSMMEVSRVSASEMSMSEISPEMLKRAVENIMDNGMRLYGQGKNEPIWAAPEPPPCELPPFALALTGFSYCSYSMLQHIADAIAFTYQRMFPASRGLVVVCECDMAKALGQALELRCRGKPAVLCIDQISVQHGDYIDFGEPIGGTMIPVVVKTLAFHRENRRVTS
jgi:ethanolamine utilization protein EutA